MYILYNISGTKIIVFGMIFGIIVPGKYVFFKSLNELNSFFFILFLMQNY